MFKKLKDKIAEEVKQSPLKSVQQLAQAVVSPSSSSVFEPSSSNDKFCIEEGDIEEDEKQEQAKPGGFTSVTLTGQTTSPIRDQNQKYGFSSAGSLMAEADNLFPKFEPQPTNYHVQSDWESASEVEDRGGQLEHISKESLYEAYRKIYNRYNKTKNRYHEVVTHYRQLEREKEKAKTVLTETQDKALLRISELREQCLLEQQAKAHLEEALRNELEERDHIINTLKTKVQYLKGVGDCPISESLETTHVLKEEENLIDFTENSSVSSVPLPFDASSNEEQIKWLEEKVDTLKTLLNEETSRIESLKSKLKVAKKPGGLEDVDLEMKMDSNESKEIATTFSELISKLSTQVQILKKTAVQCSFLKSNMEIKDEWNEKLIGSRHVNDVQNCEVIKQLEEQNKVLVQKLQEENSSTKQLKNDLFSLSTLADSLRRKIKLSNEHFGKNDAINCLITDIENELISEWNLCFQNFLQTRCEITVLKDTKDDLEKELLRIKEEKNKLENISKELVENNNKLKGDVETLQKDLKGYLAQLEILSRERSDLKVSSDNFEKQIKQLEETIKLNEKVSNEKQGDVQNILAENNKLKVDVETLQNDLKGYLAQLETLSTEKSDLKVSNDNLEKQVKQLEETIKLNEKVSNEKQGDVQKIIDEKKTAETILTSLKSEVQNVRSEYSHILEAKENLDAEVLSLRKENNNIIVEKEVLNNRVNDLEDKMRQIENDYQNLLKTKDSLDNKINSLTRGTDELASEKSVLLSRILQLENDLENNQSQTSVLLQEKDKLVQEIKAIKDEYEVVSREKFILEERLDGMVNELECNKQHYSKSLETVRQHADELLLITKERDELIVGKDILESKIQNLNGVIEKLELNCNEMEKVKESLSEELSSVREERDKLNSEIQTLQSSVLDLGLVSKSDNEELSIIKKEHAELTTAKTKFQEEIQRLEEKLKCNDEYYSSFSDTNMKLSQEINSLKKENDQLVGEKNNIESKYQKLEEELSSNKEELSKLSGEHNMISEKLKVLQIEYHDLVLKNETEKGSIEQIKSKFEDKEEELLSVNEMNNKYLDEIKNLKTGYAQIDEKYKSLQVEYDSMVADSENTKDLTASLSEINNKMSSEIASLKKDCENAFHTLSETQSELQKEQNISSELRNQMNSLSDSLKKKCDETNEKCQENMCLKAEMEECIGKIKILNCSLEKLTKEKELLLNYLLANLNSVKIIRGLQRNLYDFVKEFQVEISHEISNINLKMGHDLIKHLNDLLCSDTCSKKLNEVECKSKQDIDSYNSKLKNLQGPSNIPEEISQVRTTDLENVYPDENELNSKTVRFRRMGHLENSSEKGILDDMSVNDPETYLKEAISLMKSFTNLLNHNSVSNDYSVDMFSPEKYLKLNEIEGKNVQKEIVAMEAFITDFEAKYTANNTRVAFHSLKSNESNNISENNTIEVQLRQELKLKDDIIKKLQSVIEDYEQKTYGGEDAFVYKQRVCILEQENQSLTQRLEQIQESHELKIKNLISEYEKKLEEVEEENNLYDFEKLDKEKKYVMNEMKEQIKNLQQDLEERGDAFEKLYEEHQHSTKNFDEEIHQLRSNHDKELREQDKKWRQCLDRRLAEEESRHQQELSSLNMQWNAERRELETARRLAVNAVESGSGTNELLRRQVQALTVQLSELRNNRCEACDRKRKSEVGQEHKPPSIQDCTEMEYLRNILYEYMMGKEPLVLAKVLCALVKFDENQTREIVSKEEHRITLFGQLGLL